MKDEPLIGEKRSFGGIMGHQTRIGKEQFLSCCCERFVGCCERFVGAGRVGSFVGATGETRRNEARSGVRAAARAARVRCLGAYGEIEAKDKDRVQLWEVRTRPHA